MNHLLRKSSSSMASITSRQSLTALMSMELFHLVPSVLTSETGVQKTSNVFNGESRSFSGVSEKYGSKWKLGVREFHFSTTPLEIRASSVLKAEYAVDDFSDEEKDSGKKDGGVSDEGLEISKLGIDEEIVKSLSKKGITKLFPIQVTVYL